jgi:uncharacterized membrane protein YgdD (TMEM256/DUF423 family)
MGSNLDFKVYPFSGAVLGLLAVALGAFGAHLLQGRLPPQDLDAFHTAVRYQMVHALALVALAGIDQRQRPGARMAGRAFLLGIGLFSGSLYLLVSTGQSWLGAVTPFGGVSLLVGWAALAWTFLKS